MTGLQLPAQLAERLAVIEERLDRLEHQERPTPALSAASTVRTRRVITRGRGDDS